ncbi:MAG TPA: amino acid adenylation domain-containing protein, partial [Inquilinus sp.]
DDADRLVLDTVEVEVELAAADPSSLGDAAGTPMPLHPAYVIYTSGSTGRPKGVAVSHGAIVNRLRWMQAEYGLAADDRVLQKTPSGFDVSVWEFFWPLIQGATLVVARPGGHRDPVYLARLIRDERITTLHFVPSMLHAFLQEPEAAACTGLRRVFCSGEALSENLQTQFHATLPVPLHNLYGPTEAAVDVTYWECRRDAEPGPVPLGRPIWNTQLYVLDPGLQPVPVGVNGELYLAGANLARGYINRSTLTAERFVANPYGPFGSRMYRTGDLVRWRPDGTLDFLGRIDHQVKLRGFRIELGEIEAALIRSDAVVQAAVIDREDRSGDRTLAAYVVLQPGAALDPAALRQELARHLPDYMVPTTFTALDALPLTPSGKLDRKALPAPERQSSTGHVAPRTPLEEILAGLFAETLGLASVSIHDNFFDHGGHSMLATRLVSRIRSTLGAELPIHTLFGASTVAELAERLEQAGGNTKRPPMLARPRPDTVPLSFAQQRLWFLHRLGEQNQAYKMPLSLRLEGMLDVLALEAALGDVVLRHESLRTIFPETDGTPFQYVMAQDDPKSRPGLQRVDVGEDDLTDLLARAVAQPIRLEQKIPVRATLFRLGVSSYVLLVVVHHIAADGASLAPLARDVLVAYAARLQAKTPEFNPLPVQYVDYTLWQRDLLGLEADPDSLIARQSRYWRQALAGLHECISLPTDRPRPSSPSYRGEAIPITIDADLHGRLRDLTRRSGASLFMLLQAGLALTLSKLGAGEDIAIGSPIAGRTDSSVEELVGFFVNTLVLRTDLSGDPSVTDLITRVRDTCLAAYDHQDLPFERLVEILNPTRSQAHSPLFQVMLVLQNVEWPHLELPGLTAQMLMADITVAKFDLTFTLAEIEGGLRGYVDFATDLYDRATVETMAARFTRVLEAMADDPARRIGTVDLLAPEERQRLLVEWNDTARPVPEATMPGLFEAQVAQQPEAPAVISEDGTLSYAELNLRANRLAHHLIGRGIGPGAIVAVALPRSAGMVIGVLAAMKAGAAYLPIDPTYPSQRIAFMLADSRPACVLTDAAVAPQLFGSAPRLILDDEGVAASLTGQPAHDPTDADRIRPLALQDAAYVIYTSGSTGLPKGTVVSHAGVVSLAEEQAERFAITSQSRVLQFASASFDASVMELLMAFPNGAALVVPAPGPLVGARLAEVLTQHAVSHALIPPVALASVPAGRYEAFRTLVVGGDACPPDLVARWSEGRRMINAYGPTETTIVATLSDPLSGHAAPPIGRPIRNTWVYALDAGLQPAPTGVPGELYVAGTGLARGYLNRPDLTA